MIGDFGEICNSIPNDQLRGQLSQYLARMLPDNPTKKDKDLAMLSTISKFPEYIDYFIKYKEENGDEAHHLSNEKIRETETLFISTVKMFVNKIKENSSFYDAFNDTFEETYQRVLFLKEVIENNDGYKIFYIKNTPIKREADLQLLFRLTWFASPSDVNSEVNNGRGPVDYKISRGAQDKTLVEFKLASNSKLKQNLKHQVDVYEKANQTKKSIKVILYFSDSEYDRIKRIFKELDIKEGKNVVTIDATYAKESASNVK